MVLNLLDIISIVTLFQLILLTVVMITHERQNLTSHKILTGFLLSNALLIAMFLAVKLRIIRFYGHPSFYLLLGPLLYLYTRSLCYKDFHFERKHWAHFFPFSMVTLFLLYRYFLVPGEPTWTQVDYYVFNTFLHGQILAYIILTIQTLRQYRKKIKMHYSSLERIDLSWLLFLMFGFGLMWFLDAFSYGMTIFKLRTPFFHNALLFGSMGINLVFASAIVFRSLKQTGISMGIEAGVKYEGSNLTAADKKTYLEKLKVHMEMSKSFLNPTLTVNELADELSISPRYLSQVINEELSQNFYDYINGCRIDEAKRLLQDGNNDRKTVLEILFDAGFNSKSAFNLAFKKNTGMTPTEFRKASHQPDPIP